MERNQPIGDGASQPTRATTALESTSGSGDAPSSRSAAYAAHRSELRRTLAHAAATRTASRELHVRSIASRARAGSLVALADSVRAQSEDVRAALRASVKAYAHLLRASGLLPEAMLVEVKEAVREATPPDLDAQAARALLEDAVRWSIEAYYDAA